MSRCGSCKLYDNGCEGNMCIEACAYTLQDYICDIMARAEAAEARVHELETTHRTEMCSDGYDCVQLGKARKAAADAEERVEKLDGIVHSLCSDLIEIANRFNFEIAKYCGKKKKKCVIINGFCQKRNINCLGFIPKQAVDL